MDDDTDHLARGEELLKKAEKKLNCCSVPKLAYNSNYDHLAQLLRKSANSFRLAKSWDKAGSVFVKLSKYHMKLNKYEAAIAYKDAAHCYKKTSREEAISCLKQAITIYTEIGTRYFMAAVYCEEIGELYELNQDLEHAISYFERAAEFFELEDFPDMANPCKQKVAQFCAQLQHGIEGASQKAVEIYEDFAKQSLNNRYGVGGHLFNAGICQLCQGDFVAIANSLERYQNLDPTFSRSREYKFLADLAAAIDGKDVAKFTRVFNKFEDVTPLDSWKSTLLLKVKDALKAKEMEKDERKNHAARGEELLKKAEKKLNCCCFPLFASKSNYEDATQLFHLSANSFKLAKSWDKAGSVFIKLSKYHMKLDSKYEAANAYVDAAHCYKKTSTKGAISCLKQAIAILTENDRHYMATNYCKDLAASIDEEDVAKFTRVVEEFEKATPLDSWKSTLLFKVKDALKAKEMEEDDLT